MNCADGTIGCAEARSRLHDLRRGRLDDADRDAVVRHLRGCEACRREDEAEALLDGVLMERLTSERAPGELRERIEAMAARSPVVRLEMAPDERAPRPGRRRGLTPPWRALSALAAAVVLVASGVLLDRRLAPPGRGPSADLAGEAIGDHLRSLTAAHPYDIESSASHEVKPWFEGRIEFAPNVPGDRGELRLRGGSVGYFVDRKAAVITYALRRHALTLIAFPVKDLPWPREDRTLGGVPVHTSTSRGFHVAMWRHGDVGYAAVSDVSASEFWNVAGELARATAG